LWAALFCGRLAIIAEAFQLNRLTKTNSTEAISERGSPPYNELVKILRETRFTASPATTALLIRAVAHE
jgi:hypothetical protein